MKAFNYNNTFIEINYFIYENILIYIESILYLFFNDILKY